MLGVCAYPDDAWNCAVYGHQTPIEVTLHVYGLLDTASLNTGEWPRDGSSMLESVGFGARGAHNGAHIGEIARENPRGSV